MIQEIFQYTVCYVFFILASNYWDYVCRVGLMEILWVFLLFVCLLLGWLVVILVAFKEDTIPGSF